jgi:hypothetical protein
MNLLCVVGRHRWVTRQGKDELGEDVTYRQCERCLHYLKTSHWSRGEGYDPPQGYSASGGGGSIGL